MKIFVLLSGWVLVGRSSSLTATGQTITNGYCVRKWGTTNGLGEIALNGPTKDTVLDYFGSGSINNAALLYTIECDESKWPKK